MSSAKIITQRKKLSKHLLVTRCLPIVHLMKQKTNLIVTKAKTVWKGFVWKDLREHAMKIISFEEKEMIPLTDKENKFYEKQKFVTSARKNLIQIKMIKMDLNYTVKSEIIVITQENLEELLLVFAI